jgi:hypothetical protein
MGANSRRKGASGERELVGVAIECGFPAARRGAPMQCADGDALSDVDRIPGLWAETKRYRRTPVSRLLRALLATPRPGYTSALFWRDDGDPEWRVALDAPEFFHCWRELTDLRSEVAGLRAQLERARRGEVDP